MQCAVGCSRDCETERNSDKGSREVAAQRGDNPCLFNTAVVRYRERDVKNFTCLTPMKVVMIAECRGRSCNKIFRDGTGLVDMVN